MEMGREGGGGGRGRDRGGTVEGMIVTGRASWPRGRAFGEEVAGSELEKEEGKEEGKVVGWEIGRGEVEVGGGGSDQGIG